MLSDLLLPNQSFLEFIMTPPKPAVELESAPWLTSAFHEQACLSDV